MEVGGRTIALTNLDKVMYPATGTTKGDVIRYYSEIAPYLLPYASGRPVTRKRWVNGVGTPDDPGEVFFQKDLGDTAPDWVPRAVVHHKDHDNEYPVLDGADGQATLVWLAQIAALELHVPQWRFAPNGAPGNPDRLVIDLDPGEGTGLPECVEVAKLLRAILDGMGLPTVPVTSGSKGLHLYAALDGTHPSDEISALAHELARSLEADHPDLVISTMGKVDRRGKVLVDWSQNNANKTTVAPYSLRGRMRPTVAMPRTWREVTSGKLRQVELGEVMGMLTRRGDAARPLQTATTDRLEKYRSMRDPRKTPEPVPSSVSVRSGEPTFVIQKHAASRLHYDFRLERNGVLVSWAVPKGVPGEGESNHLAVHVEDHPVEYGTFAGDIPTGEYGAGHVDIWDHGTYDTEKWRDDEVIVTLHGARDGGLGGGPVKVALIRTDRDGGTDWLMHRMALDHPGARPAARTRGRKTAKAASKKAKDDYHPMLAELGSMERLPDGNPAVEMKWDGVRVLAYVREGATRLVSRNGIDITARYPEFGDLAPLVDGRDAVLDGEVIAVDSHGYPSFSLLQRRMLLEKAGDTRVPVRYMVFDLLALDGEDVAHLPFGERRRLLERAVHPTDTVLVPLEFDGTVQQALDRAQELHLEGVVVKDPSAPYAVGRRSAAWTKIKFHRTQEVVIAGWRPGKGRREGGVGSLLMAIPDGTDLRYVGRVGTGFDDAALDELDRLVHRHAARQSAVVGVPRADARDAHWVTPALVGEVEYAERTRDGRLRQPSWRGLRPDKSPSEVRVE